MTGLLECSAISRNGKYIARGSDENVGIWEVSSGRAIKSLPVKGATTILFGPDSTHVATANWNYSDPSDRSVQVWNIGDGHEVGRLQLLEKSAPSNVRTSETQLAFSEDGGYLASENQGTIRIWNMMKEQETERWESLAERQLVFSLDGKYPARVE